MTVEPDDIGKLHRPVLLRGNTLPAAVAASVSWYPLIPSCVHATVLVWTVSAALPFAGSRRKKEMT